MTSAPSSRGGRKSVAQKSKHHARGREKVTDGFRRRTNPTRAPIFENTSVWASRCERCDSAPCATDAPLTVFLFALSNPARDRFPSVSPTVLRGSGMSAWRLGAGRSRESGAAPNGVLASAAPTLSSPSRTSCCRHACGLALATRWLCPTNKFLVALAGALCLWLNDIAADTTPPRFLPVSSR